MLKSKLDNPLQWTMEALIDRLRRKESIPPLAPLERLDDRTALVTGANSGLGEAVATELARRGAHVIMACRSGIPEAGERVRRASGGGSVEMMRVDLSDLRSVHLLSDELRDRGVTLDRVVLNAGVMTRSARASAQGFELMFAVNFLANHVLTQRLLSDGVIPNRVYANAPPSEDPPRIVLVSSEVHRSGGPIAFESLGAMPSFGAAESINYYGKSKLLVCTLASELSRQLMVNGSPEVGVHALCPGGVNSNMAREAPWWVKPALGAVMRAFFNSPTEAAVPVVYLSVAEALRDETGWYLHMTARKEASEESRDRENGARLFAATRELLESRGLGIDAPPMEEAR